MSHLDWAPSHPGCLHLHYCVCLCLASAWPALLLLPSDIHFLPGRVFLSSPSVLNKQPASLCVMHCAVSLTINFVPHYSWPPLRHSCFSMVDRARITLLQSLVPGGVLTRFLGVSSNLPRFHPWAEN